MGWIKIIESIEKKVSYHRWTNWFSYTGSEFHLQIFTYHWSCLTKWL